MTVRDLRSLTRRFQVLLVLRFVPIGLFVTVFVLLMQDRGLSLGDIGLATAAQGVVMLFLELPSGGLADALGRKPVLLLASGVWVLATVVLLLAHSVPMLALAAALLGVFRALDSGPLQAWFIDACLAADPDVDIEQRLAGESVAICLSIGAGALLASGIVGIDGVAGLDPLVSPFVVALVLQLVGIVAISLLMDEPRRGQGWPAARAAVRSVPTVTREAVDLIRASHLLVALVTAELLWGFGMFSFETLLPPRMAELAGGADDAARVLGPVITAAWVLSALGAAMAPRLVRRFGAPPAAFGLRIAHGIAVAGMAWAGGVAGLVVAYLACYWAHSATAPIHYGMVHRSVEASHRATVVSANSLTSQVGGAISGIVLGALADSTSVTTAMFVSAVVLAAAAPLYLLGHTDRGGTTYDGPVPLHL